MPKWERLSFWLAYLRGRAPWDTNVTPPELVHTIEGPDAPPPGRALDLGCGTGTNVIYLAQQGWDAVGVDFINKAIRRARAKAQTAGVTAHFFTADATRLDQIQGLAGSFDFVLDIGCFHSLAAEPRLRYAAGLKSRLRPGAVYLLYAWEPHASGDRERGVSRAQIEEIFAPALQITRIERGADRGGPSAWYWLKFVPKK